MLKNYFKIAWRNLVRNKGFSIINIVGLATGLACFILIALYVTDELSFDRFHKDAKNIYRVNSDIKFGGTEMRLAVCSDPMGAVLKKDYPDVEEYTRIYASNGAKLIKKGNSFINEAKVANVDSTFFNVFSFPAIEGDVKNALDEPNTVVLSESAAVKYFGTPHAIGQTIEADKTPYKVTAVIKDMPRNSHFHLDFLFSMDNVDYIFGRFMSHNFQTYIKLRDGTDYKKFNKNFDQVIAKYIIPQAKQYMQVNSIDDFKKSGNNLAYSLIPMTDIHLHSDRFPELEVNGNIQYVYIFSAVALFILLIACVNFMNLSTARSAKRAKEIGIRKVLGTERKTLIAQFLVESWITVVIALVIALLVAYAVLPLFNDLAGKSLSLHDMLGARILLLIILLPFLVGALAGSYPAFFLSGFKPIAVLKGKGSTGVKKSSLRSGLVIFQFATSIILIIGTIVVYNQLNYIQAKKLGFQKEQVLIIDDVQALSTNAEAFRNEVLSMPGVKSGTLSSFLPVASSARSDNSFSRESVMTANNGFNMQVWGIDYDYIPTMGMNIVKGRNFSKDFADSNSVIINETAAGLLRFQDPVGQKIYTQADNDPTTMISYTIVGVVRNFNYESLRQGIGPLSFHLSKNAGSASFKVNSADIKGLIGRIESRWKTIAPGMPFSYRFLDESFNDMYRSEQRIGKLAITFSVLAIIIACMGLFGLATYMAEQRTKEIGIRKVLGASVGNITGMLSKDFLNLVLIASVIAFPLAWWGMHTWLQDFAYRVGIEWWIFVAAGLSALLIATLTVSFQAIRAAIANPVKSLRSE